MKAFEKNALRKRKRKRGKRNRRTRKKEPISTMNLSRN